MRSTCSPVSLLRYAVSSLVAFGVHCALAYALPTLSPEPRSDDGQQQADLVWLETASLTAGVMVGTNAKRADGQGQVGQAPRAAQAERVRRKPKLGTQNRVDEGPRASHTAAEVAATNEELAAVTTASATHGASRPDEAPSDHASLPQGPTGGAPAAPAAGAGHSSLGAASGALRTSGTSGAAGAGGLVHGPILRTASGGCPGYFPAHARAKHGEVEIDVTVDAGGHASASSVLIEAPSGQGFGLAARGCVRTLRFAPAADRAGAAVAGHARLKLRFDRPVNT